MKGINTIVEPGAEVGERTTIWHNTVVRSSARIGKDCMIGSRCEIAGEVGDRTRIQNNVDVWRGVRIGRECFIGPHVSFTNVRQPSPRELAKGIPGQIRETVIEDGVMLGANCSIVCGVRIGADAVVGAGSVVVNDVEPGTTAVGNPARRVK